MIFRILFSILFSILSVFLVYRQFFQYQEFKEQERKQGQRRIIRPGPRGDVFDRNGNLLIGNKAHFSAKLHLDVIDREIWEKKKLLRNSSILLVEKLKAKSSLSLEDLISFGFRDSGIAKRFIRFSGNAKKQNQETERVSLFFRVFELMLIRTVKGNGIRKFIL